MNKPSILGTILNGQLQSDLFSLLCFSLASKQLVELAAADSSGGLGDLIAKRQHDMIIDKMIRCATKIRILDDLTLFPRDSERRPHVGNWLYEKGESISKNLKLREACNKIIHCEEIEFHFDKSESNNMAACIAMAHLKGTDKGKRWEVVIEIERFVASAAPYIDPSWMHEL